MASILKEETLNALNGIIKRQGGTLFFEEEGFVPNINTWISAVRVPIDYKPFSISIYDTQTEENVLELILMVSPRDIVIGQGQVVSSSYTRTGWVPTLWGEQQSTIAANGTTVGFFFLTADGRQGGLTNFRKKDSQAFLNFLTLASIFRNNGYYFLDGEENPNIFRNGYSRVINVMDTVKIEYDRSTYLGSFSSFVITESATEPHRLEYNFEYVISSFGLDKRGIEGHVKRNNNSEEDKVRIGLQGSNTTLNEAVQINEDELNQFLEEYNEPSPLYANYRNQEFQTEKRLWEASEGYDWELDPEGRTVTVATFTMRVTRGWRDAEPHEGKMDYRTASGIIRSFSPGVVTNVTGPTSTKGASNYVVVQSEFQGKTIFVRYYHLDSDSIRDFGVRKGYFVFTGTPLGREGTDHGAFPRHCDFEVRESRGMNKDYYHATRVDATPFLDFYVREMQNRSESDDRFSDYKFIQFKSGELG